MNIAALFVRSDSVYMSMPDVDAWDKDRDATKWPGGCPVVAHPPCRGWGRLRHFSKAGDYENSLAPLAVGLVRQWGGVLEHPANSSLWRFCSLPMPSQPYSSGEGWTLDVDQFWWGHKARKRTWLFIVGIEPWYIPQYPIQIGNPTHVVDRHSSTRKRYPGIPTKWLNHADRERTPLAFAQWLVSLASKCSPNRAR